MEKPIETVVAATNAKNTFGSLIGKVADNGESIIVELQGKPRAAIISIEEYRLFRSLQEAEPRREAIATIRQLREEISERNKDMTEDQIERFAQLVRSEVAEGLVARGIVRFVE